MDRTNYPYVIGETVEFGKHPQHPGIPITWYVLDIVDGKALLISQYGLDCQPYNTERQNVTWETCSLRKWLNGVFLNIAFNSEEFTKILSTTINPDTNKYGTDQGQPTKDKVFLLSVAEANKYFNKDILRICTPMPYLVDQGVYKGSSGGCRWWLRSLGNYQVRAATVNLGGTIDYQGCGVDGFGSTRRGDPLYGSDCICVRPALWINLRSDIPTKVSNISVYSPPQKTEYYTWETLNLNGLELEINYCDGTQKHITNGFICSPMTLDSPQNDTVTVYYGGESTSFSVKVQNKKITEKVKIGDFVTFGSYIQDYNAVSAKSAIEWQILDKKENQVLLISKYALDCMPYTWKKGSLRTWLNNTFYKTAFNSAERKRIISTTITDYNNSSDTTNAFNTSTDKVFLLSKEELVRYFNSDKKRQCIPSKYAKARGAYTWNRYNAGGKSTCWWLRSCDDLYVVKRNGSMERLLKEYPECVRPALWISLDQPEDVTEPVLTAVTETRRVIGF